MKKTIKIFLIAITILLMPISKCQAATTETAQQVSDIQKLKYIDSVINDAQQVGEKYNIAPSLIASHSALESNYGTSQLSAKYHNYFGIKAKKGQPYVILPTKEFVNDHFITINAKFVKFNNRHECFVAYAKLLNDNKRYSNVVGQSNYQTAAINLSKDGYATGPQLANKIIAIDNRYQLFQYDPR